MLRPFGEDEHKSSNAYAWVDLGMARPTRQYRSDEAVALALGDTDGSWHRAAAMRTKD
jgi:hypothetical protein